MTLIKINDGESITIQMNHDKSEKPYSITIMRRSNCMMLREFSKENNDWKALSNSSPPVRTQSQSDCPKEDLIQI